MDTQILSKASKNVYKRFHTKVIETLGACLRLEASKKAEQPVYRSKYFFKSQVRIRRDFDGCGFIFEHCREFMVKSTVT